MSNLYQKPHLAILQAMATGADIPPELFAKIVGNLSAGYDLDTEWLPNQTVRESGITNCALVCLHWAQQCRTLLFKDADVLINSVTRAARFRNVVLDQKGQRLVPILSMIDSVDLQHNLDTDMRSHWQIIGALIPLLPAGKLRRFHVRGPCPTSSLRTPYWAISKPLPQYLSSYRSLRLGNLHFASIADIAHFASHFPRLKRLRLYNVAWDESDLDAVVPPTRPLDNATVPGRALLDVLSLVSCTEHASLWYRLVTMSGPRSRISRLSQEDLTSVGELITSLGRTVKLLEIRMENTLQCEIVDHDFEVDGFCIQIVLTNTVTLYFVCSVPPGQERTPLRLPQITACSILIDADMSGNAKVYAKEEVWSCILNLRSLNTLIFVVDDLEALSTFTKVHPSLCRPTEQHPLRRHRLLMTSFNRARNKITWAAFDPDSCALTGEEWETEEKELPEPLLDELLVLQ